VAFDEVEKEIVATLIDYRYLATDAVLAISEANPEKTMEGLRNLQDFCVVEFRDGFFHLAAPIREAARRDARFLREAGWHRVTAKKIVDAVNEYSADDQLPINLVQTATMAAIRGVDAPEFIRALVLPSHLLIVAREHYDNDRRLQCIDACKQAYDIKAQLTSDAEVETLRLWALSAVRLGDAEEYDLAHSHLRLRNDATATRVRLFIEGFKARLEGRPDLAEEKFLAASKFTEKNASINREIAKLYCGQRRYVEAERYARQAYAAAPTNPYILDILLETLLGKLSQGLRVDDAEVGKVTEALRTYGNHPGFSFFTNREAQRLINARRYPDAILAAEAGIAKTPNLPPPYFLKAEAELKANRLPDAAKTIASIKTLLDRVGGSNGEISHLAETEASLLIEQNQFSAAKNKIDQDRRISSKGSTRLSGILARSVAFSPQNATPELRHWAKSYRDKAPRDG
jgi:tetratricopeptide (TPR) repeat protein